MNGLMDMSWLCSNLSSGIRANVQYSAGRRWDFVGALSRRGRAIRYLHHSACLLLEMALVYDGSRAEVVGENGTEVDTAISRRRLTQVDILQGSLW